MNELRPSPDDKPNNLSAAKRDRAILAVLATGGALMTTQVIVEQYTGVSVAEKVGRIAIGLLNVFTRI
jgi:hypothetical protein